MFDTPTNACFCLLTMNHLQWYDSIRMVRRKMSRKGNRAMLQFETTNRVLQEERLFEPTDEMRAQANITAYMRAKGFDTYEALHQWTIPFGLPVEPEV